MASLNSNMASLARMRRKEIQDLKAELAEARAQTNFWENKYTELEIELRDTRATLRQSLQHRDTLRAELAEARAQIAEWRGHHDRKDHRCFELAQQLEEARAQIAKLQENQNKNVDEWLEELAEARETK